jgi:hypothetical protein
MTPDKINELIPEIHKEQRIAGEWEFMEIDCPDREENGQLITEEMERNARIAIKLDLITEAIVDAMRARRMGARFENTERRKYIVDNPKYCSVEKRYQLDVLNTYEDHLALALQRTLDLMGFYGWIYQGLEMREVPVVMEADWILRSCLNSVCNISRCLRPNSDLRKEPAHSIDALITGLLDVAELDEIDLEWHCEARRKYEREVK